MDDQDQELLFKEMYFFEQSAQSVIDYTSTYKNRFVSSFHPKYLIGEPTNLHYHGKFPSFLQTYMLRTYGKWWNESEASQREYMPEYRDPIESEDYIIVNFEEPVLATRISIYESFNPGAVVRIWGGKSGGNWYLLWQGAPQKDRSESRPFSPKLKIIHDLIHLVRVDFNQSLLDYHTGIDAVLLAGYKPKITAQLNNLQKQTFDDNVSEILEVRRTIHESESDNSYDSTDTNRKCEGFLSLPPEVIAYIFRFLDLRSLRNCALVCRTFRKALNNYLFYHELSLKRFWYCITNRTLEYLEPRCKLLTKLDLSWCGNDNKITEEVFIKFLSNCGTNLTHLSLGKCKFVNQSALETIANCKELTELRLRHCAPIQSEKFSVLAKLSNLIILDLYSATIDCSSLIAIIQNNKGIQHLIIDLCERLINIDLVTKTLATNNKNLRTFSCWGTHSITIKGIVTLADCSHLRELDLGWCFIQRDLGDKLSELSKGCPKLLRLILAGWHFISDENLLPVIRNCRQLQQLDLLGAKNVSENVCEKALEMLTDLKLLDVSFCKKITLKKVESWRKKYPHVAIQKCEYITQDSLLKPWYKAF